VKIKTCLRCGSTDLQNGVIYEYFQFGKSLMEFQWKPESKAEDSVPLFAILCKSCGHNELAVDPDVFIKLTKLACPHCKAIYSYRIKEDSSPNIVKCANCNKEFEIYPVQTAAKSDRLIEEIEKDLLED
jgi:predicted Zn finger-like uncharacterized protein